MTLATIINTPVRKRYAWKCVMWEKVFFNESITFEGYFFHLSDVCVCVYVGEHVRASVCFQNAFSIDGSHIYNSTTNAMMATANVIGKCNILSRLSTIHFHTMLCGSTDVGYLLVIEFFFLFSILCLGQVTSIRNLI